MLILVQRPQHKSTPDPVAAPKNIPFGTIFIKLVDTKTCCTLSGLELAPKGRKKITGTLSCIHKGLICIQSLWHHPKKILLCKSTKKARYVQSLQKKLYFWPSQSLKKLTGALSCMHKGPKDIQPLWDHPIKIPFVQKHKEGAICAILREKTHFWPSQRLKKVMLTTQGCARLRTGPIIMQITRGYQKKKFIV